MKRVLMIAALLAACAAERADVTPPGDYTLWKRIDTYGETPGHGDTYRIIYANAIAESYDRGGVYPDGTVLVKEVYDRDGDGPGALRVIELARRIGSETGDQAGWLFSAASTPNGGETVGDFCWRRCHQAAPFQGAWFDYSK